MRKTPLAFVVVFAAGVIALLALATFEKRDEAFTLGVVPATPLHAKAGQTICQSPIDVPAQFDRAELTRADGTTIAGRVNDARTHRPMRAPVPEGSRIEVCVEGPVSVLGNAAPASRSSEARRNGRDTEADMAVVFDRAESTSLLALIPDVVERASLFHGAWVKPWLVGLLGVLLLTAFPLLLGVALRESSRPSAPVRPRAEPPPRIPSARERG
jgi:hypothetical protein